MAMSFQAQHPGPSGLADPSAGAWLRAHRTRGRVFGDEWGNIKEGIYFSFLLWERHCDAWAKFAISTAQFPLLIEYQRVSIYLKFYLLLFLNYANAIISIKFL